MKIPTLRIPFFLALIAHLFSPFPSMRLMAFAPFLAIVLIKKELLSALWISVLVGLLVDSTTCGAHFGFYALSYLATVLITFRASTFFFEERLLSLSFFSATLSFIWTLFFLIFSGYSLTFNSLVSSLFLMPLFDAVYAFFWFTCPLLLYTRLQKKVRHYS